MEPRGAAISTCPIEVLTEILVNCLPDAVEEGLNTHIFSTSHPPAPVILSQVCSLWRKIALSNRLLWSTLYLDLDNTPAQILKSKEKLMELIERWTSRPMRHPFSLVIRGTADMKYRSRKHMESILRQYAHRLLSVQLWSDVDVLERVFFKGPFPVLEELHIKFDYEAIDPVELFCDAPRLRRVRLHGYAVDSFFVLPFRHLTEFTGEITSMDIFYSAPDLVAASVSLACDDLVEFKHESNLVIVHPRLRSLDLFTGNRDLGQFTSVEALRFLTLPALEKLKMCQMGTRGIFSSFLSRSSPPLRTLCMSIADMPSDWKTSFAALSTLQHVRLASPFALRASTEFQEQFIAWLAADAHNHLPRLRVLAFSKLPAIPSLGVRSLELRLIRQDELSPDDWTFSRDTSP